jgi:endoglucanase
MKSITSIKPKIIKLMVKCTRFCKYNCGFIALLIFVEILYLSPQVIAKTKPLLVNNTGYLFKKAQKLDNGINISWLEQTWNPGILADSNITKSDFILLKK